MTQPAAEPAPVLKKVISVESETAWFRLSHSPFLLSLQAGAGLRGSEQHHANQTCDPDPVSGVCPVPASPQSERGPHWPGSLLDCPGQGMFSPEGQTHQEWTSF